MRSESTMATTAVTAITPRKSVRETQVHQGTRPIVAFVVWYPGGGDAGWSDQVARRAHNPEVAGSNPAPATERPCSAGPFVLGATQTSNLYPFLCPSPKLGRSSETPVFAVGNIPIRMAESLGRVANAAEWRRLSWGWSEVAFLAFPGPASTFLLALRGRSLSSHGSPQSVPTLVLAGVGRVSPSAGSQTSC